MTRYLPANPRARGAIVAVAAVAGTLSLTQLVFPGSQGGGRGTPAAVLFQGLCSGMALALPAAGIVLIFRTLRIINFAQTALGVAGAVLFFEFLQYTPVPFPIAFLIALAMATLGGVVVGVVTLRFFRAPRLVLTVFTIMLARLLAGQSSQVRNLPFFPPADQRTSSDAALAQAVDRLLPFEGFRFGVGSLSIRFGFAELFALEVSIVTLVALALFLRFTKVGTALRAISENAERASLLGISVGKLSIAVWALAGLLSGIGVTVTGAITTPGSATTVEITLLIAALAAAVLGSLTSLPRAIGAAILIGILRQSFEFGYRRDTDLFNVVLFALIVGGLLLQAARRRSEGGEGLTFSAISESRPVPKELAVISSIRWSRVGLVALVLTAVTVYPFVASTGKTVLGGVIALNAIAVMSLVVLTGWAGQVSLGQYAFVTIGAVVGGSLADKLHMPGGFWVAVPLATIVCGVIALIVGIPALRLKGLVLLVATFAFASAVQENIFNDRYFDWLVPDSVERPTLFFLDFEDEKSMYFLCVTALVLAALVLTNLRRSRVGRVLIAARENEANVQSFGVGLLRTKLLAFGISGAMAGFAGAVLAFHGRGVSANSFPVSRNLDLFISGVFGGLSSISGALLGSAWFEFGTDLITSPVIAGLYTTLLPAMLLFAAPGGLISVVNLARDGVLRIVAQRRQIVVPSLFADYDPDALERRLVPLGEPLPSGGLAALPLDDRWVLESSRYVAGASRVFEKLEPAREAEELVAIGAAARSVSEEG